MSVVRKLAPARCYLPSCANQALLEGPHDSLPSRVRVTKQLGHRAQAANHQHGNAKHSLHTWHCADHRCHAVMD